MLKKLFLKLFGEIGVDMGSFLVLFKDCDPSQSDDKKLPTNSFLVEYLQGETSQYDIVMSNKKVDIFDYYWDKYKKDLLNISQTEGRINPKLYNHTKKEK